MPRVIGATRVRNEAHIIESTLDHVSQFVDGIVVFDDCSDDNTFQICTQHPKVLKVVSIPIWERDPQIRLQLEGTQRMQAYNLAMQFLPDWIYYFDADEHADFEYIDINNGKIDAYKMRLYDYYITPEDADLHWSQRKFIGPEYRDILMMFRPHKRIRFSTRVPQLPPDYKIATSGSVKHYGKAISIEEWENTCKYYMHHLNERGIRNKWTHRVGKAIHTLSDFNNPLIRWEDRKKLGFKLVDTQI